MADLRTEGDTFEAVAAVRWELPSVLRLPPGLYLAWEPEEDHCVVHLNPGVGELSWSRRCEHLGPEELLRTTPDPEVDSALPAHDYILRGVLEGGGELHQGELKGGRDGGFREPRPYTIATVFLCLRSRSNTDSVLERTADALNNLIARYRFMTMDPFARSVRAPLDAIYAVMSFADVPAELQGQRPHQILGEVARLEFGSRIGHDRAHQLGANAREGFLSPFSLPDAGVEQFAQLIRDRCELDLHQELFLSAIRRMRRLENALAIIDAQSAFETFVATALRDGLMSEGVTEAEIESRFAFRGGLHLLNERLREMDAMAARVSGGTPRFGGSPEREAWNQDLYRPRNRVAHAGVRAVGFAEGKQGIVSGLKAVAFLERMHPSFKRDLTWPEPLLDLDHLAENPGSLFRLFEF